MLCVIKTKCHNRNLAEWVFWASDMSLALQYIVTSSRLMSLSTPPCIIVMTGSLIIIWRSLSLAS